MALTDVQRTFADEHVGQECKTEPLAGLVVSWFDVGGDNALLLCRGAEGPFTKLVHLPPGDEELARRAAEQSVLDEESFAQLAATRAAEDEREAVIANEAFGRQLAQFVGVDPDDAKAMEALKARLAAELASQSTPG